MKSPTVVRLACLCSLWLCPWAKAAAPAAEITKQFEAAGFVPPPPAPPPRAESEPKSPAGSLAVMHLREGFAAELVVAEPLVQSPVALDWGVDGKLWVVEMADYPMGMDGKMKPGGRIRFLEDTNGDGRYDKSTLFLDGLNFPNGIIAWRKGVVITAAPDIFYAEDTDGDGRADKREVLFTGFGEGNTQLRVNGLRPGLDNWLYCANGWSGGVAQSPRTGAKFDLTRRDLRIKPDDGRLELQSGQSEFGRSANDWGDWFGCDNSNPLFHFVLDDSYLRRNPYVPAPDTKRQLLVPTNPKVYSRSRAQKRYHTFDHASAFTAACSADFYRDELLFARGLEQHAFVCEPVHNLIHHTVVREVGASFSATRAPGEEQSEFLASEDQWFRPVMVRTGPDGALWVVDMYRYMIEHPDWLPDEGKREMKPFYRLGEERGRIYRVTKKGQPPVPMPRLDQLAPAELVEKLASPNGIVREKAQLLFVWRTEPTAVALLEKTVVNHSSPLARLHALGALEGMNTLKPALVESALRDTHPAVRRFALRLAEPLAKEDPVLIAAAIRLTDDSDSKVRLQLACSLGEWNTPAAGQALGRLAVANAQDPDIVAAVMSSALNHCPPLAGAVAAGPESSQLLAESLLQLAMALNQRDSLARLLERTLGEDAPRGVEQMASFSQFLDAVTRSKTTLEKLSAGANDALTRQLKRATELFVAARNIAADTSQPDPGRMVAASLLGREPTRRSDDLHTLAGLLTLQTPGQIQHVAIKLLGRLGDVGALEIFFRAWPSLGPEKMLAVVDECLAREPWTLELLHQAENGQITLTSLDAMRRDRLLKHRSEAIKALAVKLLAANATNPDRQKVIEEHRGVLALNGVSANGVAVFARQCSQCHQLNGVGRDIGANLLSVASHPPERLLFSILDPSREVQTAYLAYSCELTDETEVYGMIASETGHSLTFKLADGSQRTVLRSEIKSLRSGKLSIMPDGLEAGMTKQELADLIAYLRNPGAAK